MHPSTPARLTVRHTSGPSGKSSLPVQSVGRGWACRVRVDGDTRRTCASPPAFRLVACLSRCGWWGGHRGGAQRRARRDDRRRSRPRGCAGGAARDFPRARSGARWRPTCRPSCRPRSWSTPPRASRARSRTGPSCARNPYAVIEGALIAAHRRRCRATSWSRSRHRSRVERARVRRGHRRDATTAGWLPGDVDVDPWPSGPDEYLFGEETALLEVVDGRPPFPRIAPPYRRGVDEVVETTTTSTTSSGLAAHVEMAGPGHETGAPPALVDNVETLANVPAIVADGADWFRTDGTARVAGHDRLHRDRATSARPASARSPWAPRCGSCHRRGRRRPARGRRRSGRSCRGVGRATAARAARHPAHLRGHGAVGSGLGTAGLDRGRRRHRHGRGRRRRRPVPGRRVLRPVHAVQAGRPGAGRDPGALCGGDGEESDLDTITSALRTVADGARCNLASQQQAVVGRILHHWPDEPAAHAVAGAAGRDRRTTVHHRDHGARRRRGDPRRPTAHQAARLDPPSWMVRLVPRRPAGGPPSASRAGLRPAVRESSRRGRRRD